MKEDQTDATNSSSDGLKGIMDNTVRIARLKLLYLAAKVVTNSNVDKVKYSIHDTRTPGMLHFLKFLDKARQKVGKKVVPGPTVSPLINSCKKFLARKYLMKYRMIIVGEINVFLIKSSTFGSIC